jgi:putative hydrolase
LCKRVPPEIDGVRIYKGIELNVLDARGTVDMPMALADRMDYIAVGLHPWRTLLANQGASANTDALLTALHRHPFIDAVVHPTQRTHPLEFGRLLPYMAAHGITFEVNETNLATGKSDLEQTAEILAQAVALGVPVATNSDAHVSHELAADEHIQRVFEIVGLDPALAINAGAERLERHLARRRQLREDDLASREE